MRLVLAVALISVCGPDEAGPDGGSPDSGCAVMFQFYRDADGDGFGSKVDAVAVACSAPPGYVTNQHDCADGDARARPDAGFHAPAIVGPTSSGLSWDFNCDGAEDIAYGRVAGCFGSGACGSRDNGWQYSQQPCGATALWVHSCAGVSLCTPVQTEQRTQLCR